MIEITFNILMWIILIGIFVLGFYKIIEKTFKNRKL